jgi:uncharacterized membrane protein
MTTLDTERLAPLLGKILGAGAVVSTVLLALGLVLDLARVAPGLSTGLMHAGLIVLMATPLARVVVSVVEYVLARDWLFATLTAGVLAILLGSLAVAVR